MGQPPRISWFVPIELSRASTEERSRPGRPNPETLPRHQSYTTSGLRPRKLQSHSGRKTRRVAMTRKPVILCVDDTLSVLEGRKMLLEATGYRVLTATNGKEAVQVFASNS